jgi:anthranilate synthase component I
MTDAPAPGRVVHRKRLADVETPVAAMLKIGLAQPASFLLESVEGGAQLGRYSFIGLAPDLIFRADGNTCAINAAPDRDATAFVACAGETLTELRKLVSTSRLDLPADAPQAVPTFVGHMGYETIGLVEGLPLPKPDPIGTPDMLFVRPGIILVFDRLKDELHLLAPYYLAADISEKIQIEQANERLDQVEAALDARIPTAATENLPDLSMATPAVLPENYEHMVGRAKDYIAAGDIFQVVLAQRFSQAFTLPPFELYRALRRVNPSPFLYFLNWPGFAVVGSSPEILVRARDGKVTIRPIAGTRPRGKTEIEDNANAASLLDDPKECAEHLMLLDLGRNDVGRVAIPGSVQVTDSFFIERYSHVMHIVSNVEGDVQPGKDSIDALFSGFPAGTVSGAPKIRAMEIIHELESEKRGIYAGGVGYFGADGGMDSCIVLRTGIVKDGVLHVTAGAGIVADSDPASEQRECELKSGALLTAAKEAYRVAAMAKRGQ